MLALFGWWGGVQACAGCTVLLHGERGWCARARLGLDEAWHGPAVPAWGHGPCPSRVLAAVVGRGRPSGGLADGFLAGMALWERYGRVRSRARWPGQRQRRPFLCRQLRSSVACRRGVLSGYTMGVSVSWRVRMRGCVTRLVGLGAAWRLWRGRRCAVRRRGRPACCGFGCHFARTSVGSGGCVAGRRGGRRTLLSVGAMARARARSWSPRTFRFALRRRRRPWAWGRGVGFCARRTCRAQHAVWRSFPLWPRARRASRCQLAATLQPGQVQVVGWPSRLGVEGGGRGVGCGREPLSLGLGSGACPSGNLGRGSRGVRSCGSGPLAACSRCSFCVWATAVACTRLCLGFLRRLRRPAAGSP